MIFCEFYSIRISIIMEMEASAVKKKIILNKPSSYKGGQKSQNEAKTEICIIRQLRRPGIQVESASTG